MPVVGQILDGGRGQGIGLGEQSLMHGVRRELRRNRLRPHQFRRQRRLDAFLRQAPQRVFGRQQPAEVPRRIGERRRHGVPAVKDDGIARRAVARLLLFAPVLLGL